MSCVFFFKQKTAYELRISDWSSDVCSSDLLGFFMSLGNAAVFKHIPAYYPDAVGPVGGLVGMIGALGGFVLPIWFGALNDLTNLWTSCFMLLFALVGVALVWMHATVTIMNRRAIPAIRGLQDLPELQELQQGRSGLGRVTFGISRDSD